MSKEFIEKRVGSSSIAEARRQQKELSYFTKSSIQKAITQEYLTQWANRKFAGQDEFLNWIKTIFGEATFLSFFKYFRFPIPSATVVNSKIKPQLERVFFSEDSFFKYTIKGKEVETPEQLEATHFSEWMLDSMMFRHNDILITDLRDVNEPFRELISIENVVALESSKSVIQRLAFTATVPMLRADNTVEQVKGFLYMDDKEYIFYDEQIRPILVVPHDLGECPADYISPKPFDDDDIVRESLFSFVRGDMEEYSYLVTIQRLSQANGVLPTTAILRFKDNQFGEDVDKVSDGQPPMPLSLSSQQSEIQKEVVGKQTELQPGTVIDVKPRLKEDGSVDAAAVQNYIKFFHLPVEASEYLNNRIAQLQNDIIQSVTGDFKEQNEEAQNEKQVSKGFISKEDSLRKVSKGLSRIRERSDHKMLALEFGKDSVTNEAFYGSDFFPESQDELYEIFKNAPNPIERKNILLRLSRNKNRFNRDRAERQEIMILLLPYSADVDFELAVESQRVDPIDFQYQTKFNYWIGIFEATFGDLLLFWRNMESDNDSVRLNVINNLIKDLIEKTAIVPLTASKENTAHEDE